MIRLSRVITLALASLVLHAAASYGVRIEEIEGEGLYHLGDRDNKMEGHQLAVVEAQRVALEKAGTYLESVAEVRDFRVTRDEIRSYSAGILKTEEIGEPQWTMEGQNLVVRARVRVNVDKDDVLKLAQALRANEENARKLQEATARIRQLEGVIAEQNRKLPGSTGAAAQELRQARTQALNEIGQKRDTAAALAHGSEGAYLLHSRDDAAAAIPELREALRLDPTLRIARRDLGLALEKQGDEAGAVREFEIACQLHESEACVAVKDYKQIISAKTAVERENAQNPNSIAGPAQDLIVDLLVGLIKIPFEVILFPVTLLGKALGTRTADTDANERARDEARYRDVADLNHAQEAYKTNALKDCLDKCSFLLPGCPNKCRNLFHQ